MWFNSFTFLWFFLIVYGLYLVLEHRWQNRMLLVASLVFYGFWDYRFVALLLLSAVIDFVCSLMIQAASEPRRRKAWLMASIFANLGILGFFKYFNFFADSLYALLENLGWSFDRRTLDIVLPVGISFYTFQTMSYTIDVYRGQLKPTRDFLTFALYVSYFPQLVAGPIERAKNLLPRLEKPRTLQPGQIKDGLFLAAWGLFKKVIIADNLSPVVNLVFAPGSQPAGLDVLLACYAVALRIYCDFSGYSDVARGVSKMMGIELMVNFRLPFFAVRLSDFWSRWHISLTSWVRDYVFVPLGANRGSRARTSFNLVLTMTLIGLWHGAGWTFVLWGFTLGLAQALNFLLQPWLYRYATPRSPLGKQAMAWLCRTAVFWYFALGALLFRASSLEQSRALAGRLLGHFQVGPDTLFNAGWVLFLSLPMWAMMVAQWRSSDLMIFRKWPVRGQFAASVAALLMILAIYLFNHAINTPSEFIYFQF